VRILITGANGFLGRAIVQNLQSNTNYEVLPLYRHARGVANEIVGDLTDPSLYARLPPQIDLIVHGGAYVPEKESAADPELAMATNAEATLRMLEYSVKAGARRFVYISSAAVYGVPLISRAVSETTEPSPDNPYALSKLAGELMLEAYRFVHGIETAGLRFSYIYGSGMRGSSVVKKFSVLAKSNSVIPLFNSGEDFFDLIHISDAVRAVECAMRRGAGIFNIGSGKRTFVHELAKTLVEVTGSMSVIDKLPPSGKYHSKYLDISKAAAELNWFPVVGLSEGLKDI